MDILYLLAYVIFALMILSIIAVLISARLEEKRRRNSVRYKKWIFEKPNVIEVEFREIC